MRDGIAVMRALVIGCGSIGTRHLRNLLALGAGPVAACDPREETAAHIAADFGIPVFRALGEALDWRPDAALVCTPTDEHLPVARLALAAGAHLFVEKPLAASAEAAAAFVADVQRTDRVVLTGCNMRFHPGVRRLKEAVDAGVVGRPVLVRAHFGHYLPNWRPGRDYRTTYSARAEQGGGMILEAIHEIDYVRWIGGAVTEVAAHRARVGELDIEAEDAALLWLRFASGAAGEIRLDCLSPVKSRGCEVIGTIASARWVSEGKSPEAVRVETCGLTESTWRRTFETDVYDSNSMYLDECRHFLDCVSGAAAPMVDARAALEVLILAEAARHCSHPVDRPALRDAHAARL